jgi:hypothetical protein
MLAAMLVAQDLKLRMQVHVFVGNCIRGGRAQAAGDADLVTTSLVAKD